MKRNWKISAKGTIWCESNGFKLFLRTAKSNGDDTRMHMDLSKDKMHIAHRLDMSNLCWIGLTGIDRLDKLIPYADAVADRIAAQWKHKTTQPRDKEIAIAKEIVAFIDSHTTYTDDGKDLF